MNLRRTTLKYMSWCPGIEAAAHFIPDKEISNKRLMQVYVLITIAALGVGVPYLLYFEPEPPPSWIIAERDDSSGTFIEIEKEDLMEHLKLAVAIEQADAALVRPGVVVSPQGLWIKMTHDEGREIVALLGGEYKATVKTYFFKVWLNGNLYRIHIEFGKEPPKRA